MNNLITIYTSTQILYIIVKNNKPIKSVNNNVIWNIKLKKTNKNRFNMKIKKS